MFNDFNANFIETITDVIFDTFTDMQYLEFNNKLAQYENNADTIIRKSSEKFKSAFCDIVDGELYYIIENGIKVSSYDPLDLLTYTSKGIAEYIITTGDGLNLMQKHIKDYFVEGLITEIWHFLSNQNLWQDDFIIKLRSIVYKRYIDKLLTDKWSIIAEQVISDILSAK